MKYDILIKEKINFCLYFKGLLKDPAKIRIKTAKLGLPVENAKKIHDTCCINARNLVEHAVSKADPKLY